MWVWALSNELGNDYYDFTAFQGVSLRSKSTGTHYELRLWDIGGGGLSAEYDISADTVYYLTIKREGTTLTCKVYNNSARTNLLTTLTVNNCAETTWRYIYATFGHGAAGEEFISGYCEKLDLQEAVAQEKTFSLTETPQPTATAHEYKEKLFTQTQTPSPTTTLIWGIEKLFRQTTTTNPITSLTLGIEKLFYATEIINTIDSLTLLQERQFGLTTFITTTSTFQYGKETVSFLLEQFETINTNTATTFLKEMIFFYSGDTETIVTMNFAIDKSFKTFVIWEVIQPITTYTITIGEALTLPGVYALAALAFILAIVAIAIVVSRKD